jgi:hypothetical protein
MVYLCTSRGCSDRNEHLEIASHAFEINVVWIGTHNSPRYDHFVVQSVLFLIDLAIIMPIIVYLLCL